MLIPVFSGPRVIEMADECRVRVLSRAPNTVVVRARKTRQVVRINIMARLDDNAKPEGGPREDSRVSTYEEHLEPAPIVTLKIIGRDGSMRRWDDRDGFQPRRFNPDAVPSTILELARL